MAVDYDCEVIKCKNKTDNCLCDYHRNQAKDRMKYQIVICENCLKILSIEKKSQSMPNIFLVKQCPYCKDKEKGE